MTDDRTETLREANASAALLFAQGARQRIWAETTQWTPAQVSVLTDICTSAECLAKALLGLEDDVTPPKRCPNCGAGIVRPIKEQRCALCGDVVA